jgi:hypothetical protein
MSGKDEKELSNFHEWDSDELGAFFRKRGLGMYCPVLTKHKITGQLGEYSTTRRGVPTTHNAQREPVASSQLFRSTPPALSLTERL